MITCAIMVFCLLRKICGASPLHLISIPFPINRDFLRHGPLKRLAKLPGPCPILASGPRAPASFCLKAVAIWLQIGKEHGMTVAELDALETAFEHEDDNARQILSSTR